MMSDILLTLNAGSSTLKAAAFTMAEPPVRLLSVVVDLQRQAVRLRLEQADDWQHFPCPESVHAVQLVTDALAEHLPGRALAAVGHRVVHGGTYYTHPERITGEVLAALRRISPLAPLHLPPELACMEEALRRYTQAPQVACFDTAFHATQTRLSRLFALPRSYAEQGVMRYGFHGLSYEYIAGVLPESAGERVVIAHLGSGASMCALHKGKSIATSMGFSALDGLMMGTRCGSIDPGVLLYLMEQDGLSAADISQLLYTRSGLLGVSGVSADMRTLEQNDTPPAREAIDLFCFRAAEELGRLVMLLGGMDTLVFTAGIGENSPRVREGILSYASWLGDFQVWVTPTDEEAMIARHTAHVVMEGRRTAWDRATVQEAAKQ